MLPIHPGRILRRELNTRRLSANALARALRVPSGRIVDILNGKRSVTAETALRLGAISATLRNSGSICRLSTISPSPCAMSASLWSARSRQPRDRAARQVCSLLQVHPFQSSVPSANPGRRGGIE